MAPLPIERQESFAKLVAGGLPTVTAYVEAGYRPDGPNAHALLRKAHVRARVDEIRAQALDNAGIDVDELVRMTVAIARADSRRFFSWNERDGVTVRDSSELTDEEARVVCQVKETRHKGERTIDVRLSDRMQAIALLGKWFGLDRASAPDPEAHMHVHIESPASIIAERLNLLAKRNAGHD